MLVEVAKRLAETFEIFEFAKTATHFGVLSAHSSALDTPGQPGAAMALLEVST